MTNQPEYDWILVDGKNLTMRIFATHKGLKIDTPGGTFHTGLAHGFLRQLYLLKRRFDGRIIVTWDRGRERREKLYDGYKESRRGKIWEHADLYALHWSVLSELLKLTGVRQAAKRGCEADDLIYTLAIRSEGRKLIASNDKDFFQCLRMPDVHIYLKRKKRTLVLDAAHFQREFDCTPQEYFRAQCLAGDPGDDIPGLSRVGIKTALKIIRGQRDMPNGGREMEIRNRALIKLYDEHPITISSFKLQSDALGEALERYQLQQLLDNQHVLERLAE